MNKIEQQNGTWLFVAPISSLVLTKFVNFEFKVNRVTFVDASKLPLRRKRLGFPVPIGEFKRRHPYVFNRFFSGYSTYAVLRQTGHGTEVREKVLKIVRDELSILALSQLGFGRRRHNACPSIAKESASGQSSFLLINNDNQSWTQPSNLTGKISELILEGRWKQYQDKYFLSHLLKIIRGEIRVANKWKQDITNAAILAGQSQSSSDLPQAFLWNMIALELLLTTQGDTYVERLPERAEAFIGWVTNWDDGDYDLKIRDVYAKRCKFVHDGNRDEITVEDVLFSDIILLNVLINIAKHPELFGSKEALIAFSNKVQAERVLGINGDMRVKSMVRPKSLEFHRPIYSEEDMKKI